MSSSNLYGDAKANLRVRGADHKQQAYKKAHEAYKADASDVNAAAFAMAAFDIGKFDEAEKVYSELISVG